MGSIFSSAKSESKVVLITGASSGIGKESALALIKRGHIVYGAARRVDKMQDLVQAGGHILKLDVTKEEDVTNAVDAIIKKHGKIDVLVNNAGVGINGAMEDISIADARRMFDVNFFGLARLTQEVLPHMRKQKKGTIVNISSTVGKIYMPFISWYTATKHAVEGWSDCLRLEVQPFGVKVAIIEPGATKSDFFAVASEAVASLSQESPYQPFVTKLSSSFEANQDSFSPTSLIASVIVEASESNNPKRRYLAGALKELVFIRSWLGETLYDYLMLKSITP